MSMTIMDPAFPTTPDEKSAVFVGNDEEVELEIQPMDRDLGEDGRDRSVSVVMGWRGSFRAEDTEDHSDEFFISSYDRDDFVDGLLAIFPELRRA